MPCVLVLANGNLRQVSCDFDSLSLVQLTEVGVDSQLTLSKSVHVGSKDLGQVREVCHMMLINERPALLVRDSSPLHGEADIFILPNSFGSVVKHSVLNNVAAEFKILLTSVVSNLTDHVLVLLDVLAEALIHLISFGMSGL